MLLVDDLLLKPFVSLLSSLHAMAIEELYDPAALRDELKENQLLFEIGDRTEAEYERRREEIEAELEVAEEAQATLSDKVEIKR